MDRRTRNVFAVILVVVIALTGGAALLLGGSGAAPSPPSDASFADGVVVAVDARTLTDVRSFDLRIASGGGVRTFGLTKLENGVAFPPGHLSEHMTTASPVRVYYRTVDGVDQAIFLEDEPAP